MRFESGWGLPLVITAILACMRPTPMPSLLAAEPTADERAAVSPARSGLRGEADGGAVWIVSDGIGTDVEAAKLDAYRNAVRQAVGAYVDATTIVANDKLIADEIIALSGAFVSQVEVLQGSEKKDGLFTRLRVKAQVETGKVLSALHKKNVPTKSEKIAIDADSILAELATKEDRLVNAEKLLAKLFEGYPQKCFRASIVGQPKPLRQEGDNVELLCRVRIETDVAAWKELSRALCETLRAISVSQARHSVTVATAADLGRYYSSSEDQIAASGVVPLIDRATLAVHFSTLGQEAICLGMKAVGTRAGNGRLLSFGNGWNGLRWESRPKENDKVAVLVSDPMNEKEQAWEEFAIPEIFGKQFPSRWSFDDHDCSRRPIENITELGDARLDFAVVQDDSGKQIEFYKGFCRRVGFCKDGGRDAPGFLAPCLFLVNGNRHAPAGVASGLEFSIKFNMPRTVLEKRPEIRCVLK